MSTSHKVLWSEGLFLRPQHFQQQDRHLERYVELRASALRPNPWGFAELEIDRELLAIGKFGVRRARGVFPDGTPFAMPDDDPLPPPRDLDPELRGRVVCLAIPVRKAGRPDVERTANGSEALVRYRLHAVEALDVSMSGGESAPLEVCALRPHYLVAGEPTDDFACIPLAEVLEIKADRQVILDESFMPSSLMLRAAPRLSGFAAELQGLLHQRGEALAHRVVASGRGGAAEIADFLLLQAVNRSEPLAAHVAATGDAHPEDFWMLCASLAGELATFTSPGKRTPDFPAYRHDALRQSFEPVIASLRSSLAAVLEQNAVSIPLELKKFGIRVAQIGDRTLLDSAVFVLAVRADVPTEDLRSRFPTLLKIGPVEKIRDLVNLQLPGVPIAPMPVAPRQIPYHAGYAYFELDRGHQLWGTLKNSGGMAVHVGGDFPGLAMELWAVRS